MEPNETELFDVGQVAEIKVEGIFKISEAGQDMLNKLQQVVGIGDYPKQKIGGPGQSAALNAGLNYAHRVIKYIEKVRKIRVQPFIDGKKVEDDKCKAIAAPWIEVEKEGNKDQIKYDAEQKLLREAEVQKIAETNRLTEEAARKREEHNRNISLGMGGDGNVKPVPVPVPIRISMPPASITQSTVYADNWTAVIVDPTKIQESILRSEGVIKAMQVEARKIMMAAKKRVQDENPRKKITPADLPEIPGVSIEIVPYIVRK